MHPYEGKYYDAKKPLDTELDPDIEDIEKHAKR
jgi:hypothetical protein